MFTVDIANASDVALGPGPLTTGIKWRYTQRLSRAGEWELTVPADDPRLAYAALKTKLACYAIVNGVRTWCGGGVVEKRTMRISGVEAPTMALTGNDILYELARDTLRLEINYNSPFLGAAMYGQILATAPGWIYSVLGTTPTMTVRFSDETVLNALTTVTAKTGQMFRLVPPQKNILIFSTPDDSGILATNLADPLAIERNPNACLITSIEQASDATRLINRAIPYGAGEGQTRLSLAGATKWPDGTALLGPFASNYTALDVKGRSHFFNCDNVNNFVVEIGSYLQYGTYAGRVEFKEISPVTSDPLDMTAAANALLAATIQYMLNSSIPQEHYTIGIAGLRKSVYPGQFIRVTARQMRDGQTPINIDDTLIIQEVVTELDANGLQTTGLTVATTREFAQSDAQVIVAQIQNSIAYQAHPQPGPNSFTVSYREDIDDSYGATFPFWISRDTLGINSIVLRFTLDKLRSTVKTIGGTASGTVDIPNHTHSVSVPTHAHGIAIDSDATTHGFARIAYFDPTTGLLYYDLSGGGASAITSNSGGGSTPTTSAGGASTGISLNISSALSAVYGIYEDPTAAHTANELQWTVNGVALAATPVAIAGGWYELDITAYCADPLTSRPIQQANTVLVRVASPQTSQALQKRARVTAQIEVRNIIQSIAVV